MDHNSTVTRIDLVDERGRNVQTIEVPELDENLRPDDRASWGQMLIDFYESLDGGDAEDMLVDIVHAMGEGFFTSLSTVIAHYIREAGGDPDGDETLRLAIEGLNSWLGLISALTEVQN